MLTTFDDYPIHQTAEPLAYLATSDRNAYGRYWFNGFDPDGEFYFGAAFGVYPHREVMDCALSVLYKDGSQHSFRASRRLRGDRTDLHVGPLTLQVVAPMRTLRITIDTNSTGISADLTFRARSPAHAEPLDLLRQGVRTVMQSTRYSQFGMWGGEIKIAGRRQQLDAARTFGVRDRSWGVRWTGEPDVGVGRQSPDQIFWLWAPIHWPDRCTHYGLFEDPHGVRTKEFAHVFPVHSIDSAFDPISELGFQELRAGEHRLTFQPGSRFAAVSEIDLVGPQTTTTIRVQPLLRFPMIGIGYGHPTWGHGCFQGEEALTSESWNVKDLDVRNPLYQHLQQVVRATSGGEVGYGVLEQALLGPHARYRLNGFLDPAT